MFYKNQLVSFKKYPGVYSIEGWSDGVRVIEQSGRKTCLLKTRRRSYLVKDAMDKTGTVYEAFENELVAAVQSSRRKGSKISSLKTWTMKHALHSIKIKARTKSKEIQSKSILPHNKDQVENIDETHEQTIDETKCETECGTEFLEEGIETEIGPFLQFVKDLRNIINWN